jgi:hypothetical protein
MFQPFIEFKPQYIGKLKELKKTYLVTQTYNRVYDHFDKEHKADILVTDYDDLGMAKGHLAALQRLNKAATHNMVITIEDEIKAEREGTHITSTTKNRKFDKYISIIDLNNEGHLNKFREMLQADSNYKVYWTVVQSAEDLKKRLDSSYAENIKRYITQFTNWRISSNETIRPQIQVIFGELYIILKRGQETLRIRFEELEKA